MESWGKQGGHGMGLALWTRRLSTREKKSENPSSRKGNSSRENYPPSKLFADLQGEEAGKVQEQDEVSRMGHHSNGIV